MQHLIGKPYKRCPVPESRPPCDCVPGTVRCINGWSLACTHPFTNHLGRANHGSGPVLDTGDRALNETDPATAIMGLVV